MTTDAFCTQKPLLHLVKDSQKTAGCSYLISLNQRHVFLKFYKSIGLHRSDHSEKIWYSQIHY